jgi:hypothetical protein
LPISDCRLPIADISDFRFPIGLNTDMNQIGKRWVNEGAVNQATGKIGNRKSAIGNA